MKLVRTMEQRQQHNTLLNETGKNNRTKAVAQYIGVRNKCIKKQFIYRIIAINFQRRKFK